MSAFWAKRQCNPTSGNFLVFKGRPARIIVGNGDYGASSRAEKNDTTDSRSTCVRSSWAQCLNNLQLSVYPSPCLQDHQHSGLGSTQLLMFQPQSKLLEEPSVIITSFCLLPCLNECRSSIPISKLLSRVRILSTLQTMASADLEHIHQRDPHILARDQHRDCCSSTITIKNGLTSCIRSSCADPNCEVLIAQSWYICHYPSRLVCNLDVRLETAILQYHNSL